MIFLRAKEISAVPEARVPELKPSARGDSGKKSYVPLIYTEAVYFFLGTRLPRQADTHTDTHAQVSWGQWGEEGWDEQMLHPAAAPDASKSRGSRTRPSSPCGATPPSGLPYLCSEANLRPPGLR